MASQASDMTRTPCHLGPREPSSALEDVLIAHPAISRELFAEPAGGACPSGDTTASEKTHDPGAAVSTSPEPAGGAAAAQLFGPPPSAEEVEACLNDLESEARERFAERWGFDVRAGGPTGSHTCWQWAASEPRGSG